MYNKGIQILEKKDILFNQNSAATFIERFQTWNPTNWNLLDDKFPSNLAVFRPDNFFIKDTTAKVTLIKEDPGVHSYTSSTPRKCSLATKCISQKTKTAEIQRFAAVCILLH